MRKLWMAGIAAVVFAGCNCGGPGGGTSGDTSTVAVDRSAGVMANGMDEVSITVTLKNKDGQPVEGQAVQLAVTGDGNTLTQPSGKTDKQGVAQGTLRSTRAETKTISATLVATDATIELAQKPTVTFVAATATKLVVRTQPSDVVAGSPIAPAVELAFQDDFGNQPDVTTPMTVTLQANATSATLGGTLTVMSEQGAARFADLTVDKAGQGYTLAVTAPGVSGVVTSAFSVSVGAAAKLVFASQPMDAVAGQALAPAVQLQVQDAQGNPVDATADVTVSLSANPGLASLGGTVTATAAAGTASFADLSLEKAGVGYTLVATATGLASATSDAFSITPAAPAQLAFVTQPANGVSAQPLAPAVTLNVMDTFGNLATGATDAVTVAFGANPGNGTLGGTVTAAPAAGVVTFGDLTVDKAGAGYTLSASGASLPAVESSAFDIVAGPADVATSTVSVLPTLVVADGMTPAVVTVTVLDAQGNPVSGAAVSLASSAMEPMLAQPAAATDAQGIATGQLVSSTPVLTSITATVDGANLMQTADVRFTECAPAAVESCYSGPMGTAGVGVCQAGVRTCDAMGSWGGCMGEVLPTDEVCANGLDEDCNGIVDDVADFDGDGWTRCDGDCCEDLSVCTTPEAMNPGALEVVGNGLDDDCDPATSDTTAPALCSSGLKLTGVTATNAANAMDLCQATTAGAPLPSRKWGLLSAQWLFANGATPSTTQLTAIQNQQTAVTNLFGNTITPRKGVTMAGLSTGMMRDANDPGWVLPISGTTFTSAITFPGGGPLATYVNAHGGQLLPGSCAGATCPVGTGANDSVLLRLQIRVPTNARGFSYDFRFFSSEYQTFQCTTFNDHFLALLTSLAPGIPADHNISFDALGQPVSVNNGFFQDCGGNGKNCGTCPFGAAALVGTGFDQVSGGATEWLTTDAPVVPGETMTLDLMLFDVGDHIYDSDVLLDNFRWSLTPNTVGTHN